MNIFVENFKKAVTEILKEDYHYYGNNLDFLTNDSFSDIEPTLDDYDLKDFFKKRKKDPADKAADHEEALVRNDVNKQKYNNLKALAGDVNACKAVLNKYSNREEALKTDLGNFLIDGHIRWKDLPEDEKPGWVDHAKKYADYQVRMCTRKLEDLKQHEDYAKIEAIADRLPTPSELAIERRITKYDKEYN